MPSGWSVDASDFEHRPGRGMYHLLFVDSPKGRRIQLAESPQGRTFHVYIDGVRYTPES